MESVKNSAFFYNFSAELKLQKILKFIYVYCELEE